MNIKVLMNVILVRIKVREILPKEAISRIKIMENNEPLAKIEDNRLRLELNSMEGNYLRSSVYERLIKVCSSLEVDDLYLKIYEAYRPIHKQKRMWEDEYNKLKQEFDGCEEKELIKAVDKRVANPHSFFVCGHQTGGAIDLTLCDKNGNNLDMGTDYLEFNNSTKTNNSELSEAVRKNRMKLLDAMKSQGFVNYPGEWWHFCYGDAMWAAYTMRRKAIFGSVDIDSKSNSII